MPHRTVLTGPGPQRLARMMGVLRRGRTDALVLETDGRETPVIVLAPHALMDANTLLADANGPAVVWEGDRVELVGGLAPEDDPRFPAFLAATVSVIS